jgi:molecular chaperone HtpG
MPMATVSERQEFTFQAEIKQLLHLLSHSLYQSREIAVRELISNASDALDKMRFVSLTDESRREPGALQIVLEGRESDRQLVIKDTGIGMTQEELVNNLGTIAHSGSGEFLKALKAEPGSKPDLSLIGQFGVGFYSAFMIADEVKVRTRSYREETGWEWESDGSGRYTITAADEPLPRGTEIILKLKEASSDLAKPYRLQEIVRTYSGFVPYPIHLGDGGDVINEQKPIWVEPKSQVTEEQYTRFYQHLTHHTEETPLFHLHMAVDSPMQFRAIVYCPPTNMERIGFGRVEHGLNLCAKRVLVQNECRELVPDYLRFLRGLVDSEDLPLNVSRETLQDNGVIRKIRTSLVKGVLDRLDRLAQEEKDTYAKFYSQFGTILREGLVVDPINGERVAKLLRFASSHESGSMVSLDDYLGRIKEGQDRIYYLGGPDLASITKSPNLEIFRKRGLEVLFLSDPVDEFAMTSLGMYQGKRLTSIDSSDLDLPETETKEEPVNTEDQPSGPENGFSRVLDLFRRALGNRVQEVRESKRLTDSACCLVNAEGGLSVQMQKLLKMANRDVPETSRFLEVNPNSPLIRRLCKLSVNNEHDGFIELCALQLWTNAMILEGLTPEPEELVARVQSFMSEAAEKRSPLIF